LFRGGARDAASAGPTFRFLARSPAGRPAAPAPVL